MTNAFYLAILGLVGGGMLVSSLVWAFREWCISRKLKQLGMTTETSVMELGKLQWTRTLIYYVIYRYKPNNNSGEVLTRKQVIGWSHHNKLKIGSTITVCYLPENPRVSRLCGPDTDNTSRDTSLLWALIIIITLKAFFESPR